MNISMTPELEQLVHAKVKSGMYQSASELMREALRLLAERDELHKRRIDAMDAFIQVGLDEAARGEFVDPDVMWAEIDQEIAEAASKHA